MLSADIVTLSQAKLKVTEVDKNRQRSMVYKQGMSERILFKKLRVNAEVFGNKVRHV